MAEERLGSSVLELSTDGTRYYRGIDRAESAAKGLDRAFGRVSARIASAAGSFARMVGRAATRLGLAGTAAAGAAVKMGADFQTEMQRIVGLVGVAQEQVDEWRGQLIELAPALGRSPEQLAKALFFITSAGQRGAAAMETLVASTKGAVAGLGEIRTVADLATSAVIAYGEENLSASEAVDILTATVREGKAEASEIAGVLGPVISLAQKMGVEFEEVGGVMASLTRLGVPAAEVVTSLQAVLSGLLKPAEDARKALEEAGTSVEELRQTIAEEGLQAALMELNALLKDDEEALARVFPNVRALRGVIGLLGENAETTAGIMERLADSAGATEKAFESASATIAERFRRAVESLRGPATRIGTVLGEITAPLAEQLAQQVKPVLDGIATWFEENAENIYAVFSRLPAILQVAFSAGRRIIERTFSYSGLKHILTNLTDVLIESFQIAFIQAREFFSVVIEKMTEQSRRFGDDFWKNFVNAFVRNVTGYGLLGEMTGIAEPLQDLYNNILGAINRLLGLGPVDVREIIPVGETEETAEAKQQYERLQMAIGAHEEALERIRESLTRELDKVAERLERAGGEAQPGEMVSPEQKELTERLYQLQEQIEVLGGVIRDEIHGARVAEMEVPEEWVELARAMSELRGQLGHAEMALETAREREEEREAEVREAQRQMWRELMQDLRKRAEETVGDAGETVKRELSEIARSYDPIVADALQKIGAITEEGAREWKELSVQAEKAGTEIESAGEAAKSTGEETEDLGETAERTAAQIETFGERLGSAMLSASSVLGTVASTIRGVIELEAELAAKEEPQELGDVWGETPERLTEDVNKIIQNVAGAFTETGMLSGLGEFIAGIQATTAVVSGLVLGLASLVMQTESAQALMESLDEIVMGLLDALLRPIVVGLQPFLNVVAMIAEFLGTVLLPWFKMLGVVLSFLGSLVATVVGPIFEMLGSVLGGFGSMIADVIIPIFAGLAKVVDIVMRPFEALADLITWMMDTIRAAVANWLYEWFGIGAPVEAPGEFETEAFTRPLVDIGTEFAKMEMPSMEGAAEMEFGAGPGAAGGAVGAGAEYRAPRPINVSINVHDNTVAGGDLREFALMLRDEFEELGVLGL